MPCDDWTFGMIAHCIALYRLKSLFQNVETVFLHYWNECSPDNNQCFMKTITDKASAGSCYTAGHGKKQKTSISSGFTFGVEIGGCNHTQLFNY